MKGSDNSLKNSQTYGHMDQEREMKSEVEQSEGSMAEPVVVENSEVQGPDKRKKRRFTAQYKMEILRECDLCKEKPGAVGALLRREGIYSSSLVEWRRQRDSGALNALSQKRGRKLKKTAEVIEIEKWQKRYRRLKEEYNQALMIIQAQKKISEILGVKQVDTSHLEGFED
jgi:transposase-like protein